MDDNSKDLLKEIKNNTGKLPAFDESQLSELIIALRVLSIAIANPSYVDKSSNSLRATITATIAALTTISTLTTLSNIDGYQGKLQVLNNNNGAWANVVRSRIS